MDEIISSTQNGSAILAYGRAGSSRFRFLSWIGVCAAILIVIVSFFLFALLTPSIPSDRILVISLRPSQIASRLSGDTISDLPSPWRAALQTKTNFPVRIGLRKTSSGAMEPFASIPRYLIIGDIKDAKQKNAGLAHIISMSDISSTTRSSFSQSFRLLMDGDHLDATWELQPALLSNLSNSASTEDDQTWIRGTWSGLQGAFTDSPNGVVPAPDLNASDLLSASVNSDRRIADPTMTALLHRGIDLRDVETPPISIRIPSKDDTIVTWKETGSSAARIRAAFGKTISIPTLLPDQSLETLLTASTSTNDDSQLVFHTNPSNATSTDQASTDTSLCPGSLLYSMRGEVMANTFLLLHIPQSWIDRLSSLILTRDGKNVRVCVEVK